MGLAAPSNLKKASAPGSRTKPHLRHRLGNFILYTKSPGGCPGKRRLDAASGPFNADPGSRVLGSLCSTDLERRLLGLGERGQGEPAQVMGVSHWVVIAAVTVLALASLAMFRLFEKKGL